MATDGARAEQLRAVERWFLARGTPHLIDDYRARTDVFTRTRPALVLVFLVELTGSLNSDFRWWQNALALVGAIAGAVAMLAAVTRSRRRPAIESTSTGRIDILELALFLLGPPLLTALIGDQAAQGLAIFGLNVVLLGAIYLVTSYGLVPLTRWALGKTVRELGAVAGLLGRALPLLLLIQIVLFINTEMWQVADGFDGVFLGAVVLLFLVVGIGFLLTRLPRELGRLATFSSSDELKAAVVDTPAAVLLKGRVAAADLEPAPLTARQRGNVLLVALFSQGLQVVLVTLLLGAFFVVFGLLTITPDVIESWLGHTGHAIVTFHVGDREVLLTQELLKISGFLAAFSGLYFTVVLVTDGTYREEFFDEILAELRQTFAVRAVYRRARA
jgi:hypothetical protein